MVDLEPAMTDHRIRLAQAWRQQIANLPPRRVDLPTTWTSADRRKPFDLFRQFHWPPIDPATQAVDLELIDVPGLIYVRFYGRELLEVQVHTGGPIRLALDVGMPGRRQLTLGVDLAGVAADGPWGSISLVIHDRAA